MPDLMARNMCDLLRPTSRPAASTVSLPACAIGVSPPGATHEIAVVAEPARQQRVSVWKFLLLSAWVKIQSCWTVHNDQPLVSHALPLRGIGFRSLTEALDTTTAQGRL